MQTTCRGKNLILVVIILLSAASLQLIAQDSYEMCRFLKWCPKGVYAHIRYVNNASVIAGDQLNEGLRVGDIIKRDGVEDKYLDKMIDNSSSYVEVV